MKSWNINKSAYNEEFWKLLNKFPFVSTFDGWKFQQNFYLLCGYNMTLSYRTLEKCSHCIFIKGGFCDLLIFLYVSGIFGVFYYISLSFAHTNLFLITNASPIIQIWFIWRPFFYFLSGQILGKKWHIYFPYGKIALWKAFLKP